MHVLCNVGNWNLELLRSNILDVLLGQMSCSSGILYRIVVIVSSLARLSPQFLGDLC